MSAASLPPPDARTLARRAEVLLDMGRLERGLEQAELAIEADRGLQKGYFEAARALVRLGRHEEALRKIDYGLAIRPRNAWGHRLRSFAFSQMGKHTEALEQADSAVSFDPEDVANWRRRARCLLALERNEEAYVLAKRAVDARPEDAEGHGYFAEACLAVRRTAEGLAAAQQAARLGPDLPWTLHLLGDALHADGAHAEAIRTFHEAVRERPTSAYARKRLVDLCRAASRRSLMSPMALCTSLAIPALGALAGILAKEVLGAPLLAVTLLLGLGAPAVALYGMDAGRRMVDRASPGAWDLMVRVRAADSRDKTRRDIPRGT